MRAADLRDAATDADDEGWVEAKVSLLTDAADAIEILEAEVAVLNLYTRHMDGCGIWRGSSWRDCDCGLASINGEMKL
jgi:hypothetical protein